MNNYYQDIWTKKDGAEFWKNVNFNSSGYKLQEHMFRQTLLSYKNLIKYGMYKPIESVLELGAGSGRMTRIMLEVFPNLRDYDCVDINNNFYIIKIANPHIDYHYMDITSEEFDSVMRGKQYDLILASEVFMHIKPEDIERVMKLVCRLSKSKGSGIVINIDWFVHHAPEPSNWCFIHDYDKLYRENGLQPIFTADIPEIKQKLFCYGA